jgi:hypothetical protein
MEKVGRAERLLTYLPYDSHLLHIFANIKRRISSPTMPPPAPNPVTVVVGRPDVTLFVWVLGLLLSVEVLVLSP